MSKLHLILAFHNHQPVGNFEHVLEECYEKAYLPFLETLLDHPQLKVVLHYSGNLLFWIQEKHPEAFHILKTLTDSGRAEILSGGLYEPVLTVLPQKDMVLQVSEMSKWIRKSFGQSPKGMWLAERVWEPQMPGFIARAGIEYVPIDDHHFKLTGLQDSDLFGYYLTEDQGGKICVFPGSERLRYMIPFRTVDEIIGYLKEVYMRGGNPLLTMADDGEKFGVWPNTYKHVYEDRWLENFFAEIERNSDWIKTTTFSEYRSKFRPLGNIYLPTASYREMGVWSLPANDGLEYERTLEVLQKTEGEKAKQLLRGGFWRSFMVKYPEANHIHKRMFMISRRVHAAARKNPKKGRTALMELWKGQCNDAYWHGIFGGLYLPHLRSSLYRHLIRAESLAADILKTRTTVLRDDFDSDGFDDVMANTKSYTLVATEKGGSISELSLHRQAVNIFDIVSRRPEAYHGKIANAVYSCHGETRTIHDVLTVKEVGLSEHIVYDSYRRTSLIDRFLPVGTTVWDVARPGHKELGDFVGSVYEMNAELKGDAFSVSFSREGVAGGRGVMIEKTIYPDDSGGIMVEYALTGAYEGLFAVEVNMSLLGSPHALIKRGAKTMTVRSTAAHEGVKNFSIKDKYLDLVINFRFNEGVGLWHYPVETVSLSEDGVERLYQGTCLLFVRNIELQGRKKMWIAMSFGQVSR